MESDIKDRLQRRMEERKIKVPQLAKLVDIPKDRIYAWYRDGSNPKAEDRDKIQKWLDEETFIKNVGRTQVFGSIEERLIRLEAQNEVLEATLAGLLSSDPLDFAKKQAELRAAIKEAANRRFDELSNR